MSMESIEISAGQTIHFAEIDKESASILASTYEQVAGMLEGMWELKPPPRFRIIVMTSWFSFLFRALRWYAKPAFLITLPFLFLRHHRNWRSAGGWTLRNRRRPIAGVKPPRLLASSDTAIGERIFLKEIRTADLNTKMSWIFSHELTHVFSAHLLLPLWLNEGIAMVTADEFYGSQTVRPEAIQEIVSYRKKKKSATYESLSKMNADGVVYQYVRAYWITRYLMDCHSELLRQFLKKKHRDRCIDKKLAIAMGIKRRKLWKRIDDVVCQHFESQHPVQHTTLAK